MNSLPVRIHSHATRLLSIACLSILVGACDGGSEDNNGNGGTDGGNASTPAAPDLLLTPQSTKTFAFSWPEVSDVSEYRLLQNPDGVSGYTELASIDANATNYELKAFLPARINASYILEACNSVGCSESDAVFVSGTLAGAVGYVKASNNTGNQDQFGGSLALSGNGSTLAVGANGEASAATGVDGDQNDTSTNNAGAVYVFSLNGETWEQQAYVKASNTDIGDRFGTSVALSDDGSTLAVGASGEASAATGIDGDQGDNTTVGSGGTAGAVYVFGRSGETWSQQAYVKASNTDAGDRFGRRVALSADGNTLAVGADGEDSEDTGINGIQTGAFVGDAAESAGAVYVFTRSGETWDQQAYVKASNTNAGDQFGRSVSLSADGSLLAVGAPDEGSPATGIDGDQNDDTAPGAGAVYVFSRTAEDWSPQAYVKANNTGDDDSFGDSVALSADGSTLAVGATGEASSATLIDGNESDDSAENAGAVYVFNRNDAGWSQQAYVKASNTDSSDSFGFSLALTADGNTLAVASLFEASAATGIGGDQNDNTADSVGAVYVFNRSGEIWDQQAYVKASNAEDEDWFGYDVALTGNGTTLAVGARYEDSAATGINGDQDDNDVSTAGAVYLY